MKVRLYMDVEVADDEIVVEDEDSRENEAGFEALRFASWLVAGGDGYDGPAAAVVALHAETVYPDPAGTIEFWPPRGSTSRSGRSVGSARR